MTTETNPEMEDVVPGPDTQKAFRDALGRFATGVTVVTTDSEIGPLGITANSFASVSLDPPLVLWSPAKSSRRYEAFAEAKDFAIHVIGAEQAEISARFSRDGTAFEEIAESLLQVDVFSRAHRGIDGSGEPFPLIGELPGNHVLVPCQ